MKEEKAYEIVDFLKSKIGNRGDFEVNFEDENYWILLRNKKMTGADMGVIKEVKQKYNVQLQYKGRLIAIYDPDDNFDIWSKKK